MSDILIKGFDFPEDCSKCPLRKVPQMRDDICVISGCRVPNYPERPSWCYLHEVKPHGRLKDFNDILTVFDKVIHDVDDKTNALLCDLLVQIQYAPTVLEASNVF